MGIRKKLSLIVSGPVLFFALATIILSIGTFVDGAGASDKRIVSIFADGQKQTILTGETTVGEVLESADIDLHEKDLVEPNLKTAIDSDVFKINVFRARPYTIVDDNKTVDVLSAYQTPRLIAESAGIKVYPEDKFEVERINNIVGEVMLGEKIDIIRATPINLYIYGEKTVYRTHAKTVAEVLNEKQIKLGEDDLVAPKSESAIKSDMDLHVLSVGNSVTAVEEEIPYPSEKIYDSSIDAGQSRVQQAGENGRRLVTYRLELHNGVEVGRTELQSVVMEEPVKEIMVVGTKSADPGSNVAIGQEMAAGRGWVGAEWGCLYELWLHESGWNHLTANGGSGAYGIPQALPGSKMSSAGADWATNPRTQIAWGMGYVAGRYGTPCGAMGHFNANGWY